MTKEHVLPNRKFFIWFRIFLFIWLLFYSLLIWPFILENHLRCALYQKGPYSCSRPLAFLFYFCVKWDVGQDRPRARQKKKSLSTSSPSLFPSAFVRKKAYYWTNEVTIFFYLCFYLWYYGYYSSLIIHLIVWSQQKGEEEECYKSLKRVIVWSRIHEDLSVYYFILLSNQVLFYIQLYACVIQIYPI